jgi:hypothetical protein
MTAVRRDLFMFDPLVSCGTALVVAFRSDVFDYAGPVKGLPGTFTGIAGQVNRCGFDAARVCEMPCGCPSAVRKWRAGALALACLP